MPEPVSLVVAAAGAAFGAATWVYDHRGQMLSAALGFRLGRVIQREGGQIRRLLWTGFVVTILSMASLVVAYRDILAVLDWRVYHVPLAAALAVLGYKVGHLVARGTNYLLTAGLAVAAGQWFEWLFPGEAYLTRRRTAFVLCAHGLVCASVALAGFEYHDEVCAFLRSRDLLATDAGAGRSASFDSPAPRARSG